MASPSSDSLGQLLRRLSAGRTATDEALSCEAFLAEHHVEPRRVRIGRYLIRKALGRGGFGAVLLAEDPQLRRCVALKVALGVIEGRDERERFAAEAQRLAKFSDPHVVQVFDHGDSPYGPWIAMQYIEGETLHAWCSVPRPWPAVLDAYVQAARGGARPSRHQTAEPTSQNRRPRVRVRPRPRAR